MYPFLRITMFTFPTRHKIDNDVKEMTDALDSGDVELARQIYNHVSKCLFLKYLFTLSSINNFEYFFIYFLFRVLVHGNTMKTEKGI